MSKIRRGMVGAALAVALSPAVVSAGPPLTFTMTLDCSDGNSYVINFGAPKNQGTALHGVGDNFILTSNYFLMTVGGQVFVDSTRGLQGVENRGVITCTGTDGDVELVVMGWVTPRT